MQTLSLIVSMIALFISVGTFWLTLIRRGSIKISRPTTIYFGPERGNANSKVYFRALLFSTSRRGVVLEHLYVKLKRGESQQNFNIWVYGDKDLVRGSGLYISQEGIVTNHHFLLPKDGDNYDFKAGQYELEIYGKAFGSLKAVKLFTAFLILEISDSYKSWIEEVNPRNSTAVEKSAVLESI